MPALVHRRFTGALDNPPSDAERAAGPPEGARREVEHDGIVFVL